MHPAAGLLLVASSCFAANDSASYNIPSNNNFAHDFQAHEVGDTLTVKVTPDAGYTITAKVANPSAVGWKGGPTFTCTIPAGVTGVHTGTFTGTYSKGGGGGGAGKPPVWNGSAKVQVTLLKHETIAKTPADRQRTTIGVGEEVKLSTDPAVVVDWTVAGGGTCAPARGTTTTFTAPGAAATSVITATPAAGAAMTITFDVIPPTGVIMTAGAPFFHTQGQPTSGFTAVTTVIQPTTVSFYRLEDYEGAVNATADGVFKRWNGLPHAEGTVWLGYSQANVSVAPDTIYTNGFVADGKPGDLSGNYLWPIPWHYHISGDGIVVGGGRGTRYTTLDHQSVANKAGATTTSKATASKTFALGDASTNPRSP
jgi:hypothetical protein